MSTEAHQKVTARHLERSAYLYVRQSTMRQVFENTESTQRQYGLRQRAVALGWPAERVIVIDSDLGQSGASAVDRAGFQRLVAEVGMGHAGIVLGLEVSRLARNSTDWHRLLEICALSDTLILDEDGVYDPAHFNDRLLLGLKGTMSEAELHVMRARLRGGILSKARRGELRCRLPVGLVYDGAGRVVFDPDTQVQESVRLLFATVARTGALHATVKFFRQQGLLFPTRVAAGARKGELAWGPLSLGRASSALHNPWYAGAYAYGRGRWRKRPDGRARHERLPQAQWHVLIREAHPAYVSWPEYERNQQQLLASARSIALERSRSAPREGPALLQGHAVCGVCGSRMHVHYNIRRGGELIPNYVCFGRGRNFGDPAARASWAARSMPPSARSWWRPSPPWPSRWRVTFSRRSPLASRRPIACATARSNGRSTRWTAPAIVTCRWTRPTGSSPARWRPIGTSSCASSPRPRKNISASVQPIGWSSTRRNVSGS